MTTKKKIDSLEKTLAELVKEFRILQNVVFELKKTKIELTKPKNINIEY